MDKNNTYHTKKNRNSEKKKKSLKPDGKGEGEHSYLLVLSCFPSEYY